MHRIITLYEYYISNEDQNLSTCAMASSLPLFPPFNVEDDLTATGQRWTEWKTLLRKDMDIDGETHKCALLLHYIGSSAFDTQLPNLPLLTKK